MSSLGAARARLLAGSGLAALWALGSVSPVAAHDPVPGDDPLVHLLLEHVLLAIPGWLFVIAIPALIIGVVALVVLVRRRRLIIFIDEPS